MFKSITRTIWILSIISLFNDVATEMLYPVIPVYLRDIGFSIIFIGVLEGFAEAVAGISKGYFGKLSDHLGKRMPFVQFGYALSSIAKPAMALFKFSPWVFGMKTLDKIGKGLRISPRDALLSDESTPQTKGKVFGFHRAMDTVGAVLGPFIALIYLTLYPAHYKAIFAFALIPGLISVAFTFIIREKKHHALPNSSQSVGLFSFLKYWKESPAVYKKVVIGLLIFMLFNSSDVFLLLKLKEQQYSITAVIKLYIFYNMVFALTSFPLGIIGDKIGLKNMLVIGLICFAIAYAGMSYTETTASYAIIFIIYGIYAAATDGISKALLSNVVDKSVTGTAIGTFTALQSICLMIASSVAGWIWFEYGSSLVFILSGVVALSSAIYFILFVRIPKLEPAA